MKKLMIAAAAVAMIGAAQAAAGDIKYNFVAVLRTTAAIQGASTPGSYTPWKQIKLAMNADRSKFWYEDDAYKARRGMDILENAPANGQNLYYKRVNILGQIVDHLYLADASNVSEADETFLTTLQGKYGTAQIFNGREIWCCQLQYRATIPGVAGNCYRVVGVDQINVPLLLKACCTAGFVDAKGNVVIDYTKNGGFLYGFGGQTVGTAVFNEMFAYVGPVPTVLGLNFMGALAGQGTWIDLKKEMGAAKAGRYPNFISGNIVGVRDAPQCTTCCTLPVPAFAFNCASIFDQAGNLDDTTINTAAYGTFYVSYAGIDK